MTINLKYQISCAKCKSTVFFISNFFITLLILIDSKCRFSHIQHVLIFVITWFTFDGVLRLIVSYAVLMRLNNAPINSELQHPPGHTPGI